MSKKFWFITSTFFIILFIILSFFIYRYFIIFYNVPDVFNIVNDINAASQAVALNTDEGSVVSEENKCKDCVRRLIDGVYVKQGEENFYPIVAVIDNKVEARPQSGLSKANLVYELEAEGGITRYLAFFASSLDIEKIGPIRSLRPYFIDLAIEFSPLLAHVGGSPEALVQTVRDNILNINQFYKGEYFWRDKERSAPHNAYTSHNNLNDYLVLLGIKKGRFLEWKFKNDGQGSDGAQLIEISYKTGKYYVKWEYDKESNDYIRYLGGDIHYDGEEMIRAKNVIIQYANSRIIDEKLRLSMDLIGDGEALVCFDGKCNQGTWDKKYKSSRTRFYNENSEEFEFNAGKIWINIVDPKYKVNYELPINDLTI